MITAIKKHLHKRKFKKNLKNPYFWKPWDNSLCDIMKEGDFIMIEKVDRTIDYIAMSMGIDWRCSGSQQDLWKVVSVFEHGGLCLESTSGGNRILTRINEWNGNVMHCEAGFMRDACNYAFYYHEENSDARS